MLKDRIPFEELPVEEQERILAIVDTLVSTVKQ